MAKRISAKLVTGLLGKGMSARKIYKTRRISRQSTKKVLEAMAATGLTRDEAPKIDEAAGSGEKAGVRALRSNDAA